MSHLIPFKFEGINEVRVIMDTAGQPMFVAKDVAEALGYSNASDAISRHCKGVVKRYPLPTAGGTQEVRVIYEPDVYALIFGSQLESAERFKRWVFEEILPSIRKTGSYSLSQSTRSQVSALEYVDRITAKLPNLGEAALQQLYSEASYLDLGTRLIPLPKIEEKFYTATEIAEFLGVSANKIGRLANAYGLKIPAYGEYRLSKSTYSAKQVGQFYYNEAGCREIMKALELVTC